jgi:glycosyltransferase involved in cell wall biosynthesis
MKLLRSLWCSVLMLPLFARYDVTVVGPLLYADGLGRLSIGLMEHLKDELSFNFISTGIVNFKDVSYDVQRIVWNHDKTPGNVSILFNPLWSVWGTAADKVPNSHIKLAYSMIESNAIPQRWVDILNKQFDAVVVPDKFLVDVYTKSGVKIPIFVLPHGVYLDEFLSVSPKKCPNRPFTFGMSAGFNSSHKNHELLIDAFVQEFKHDPNIRLRVHGRCGNSVLQEHIQNKVRNLNHRNVEFINKSFSRAEYREFMASLDCYVLLSKGEGYSVTPREALAMGIPCIISDTTAHKTICETGLVRAVRTPVAKLAHYIPFKTYCGYNFSCTVEDACKALREVYKNYPVYLEKAEQGREWVKQYLYPNLKNRYLSLLKPKQVVLDTYNSIEKDCLVTNSKKLYEKYLAIGATNNAQR